MVSAGCKQIVISGRPASEDDEPERLAGRRETRLGESVDGEAVSLKP